MVSDWTNFSIFQGAATLNKDILKVGTLAGGKDEGTDIFRTWLWTLHQGVQQQDGDHCGIPNVYLPKVKELIEKFFLNFDKSAVEIKEILSSKSTGVVQATPVVDVLFGDGKFKITDAPAALAYIFSVQKPLQMPNPTTFDNYALPLLVLFTRCIFLAYYKPRKGSFGGMVPFMTCVMWINKANNDQSSLFLGSTYVTGGVASKAADQGTMSELQILMNSWRPDEVLKPGISTIPNALPIISPKIEVGLGEALLKALRGISPEKDDTRPLCTYNATGHPINVKWDFGTPVNGGFMTNVVLEAIVTAAKAKILSGQPPPVGIPANRNDLGKNEILASKTTDLLTAIIKIRFSPNYDPQGSRADLKDAFQNLFRFYLIPHFFLPKAGPVPPPVPPPVPECDFSLPEVPIVLSDQEKDALLTAGPGLTLWDAYDNQIIGLLDQIFWWRTKNDPNLDDGGPDVPMYGRCAETYPVTALLPTWTPARKPSDANSFLPVRGIALCARRFGANPRLGSDGSCQALYNAFTSETLTKFHEAGKDSKTQKLNNPAYRLPCDNCKSLLPLFNTPIGKTEYNSDLLSFVGDAVGAKLW